jgi:sigma-B regulation protein RsbU (phosphoserine phosphatase)
MQTLEATGPVVGPAPEQEYSADSFYLEKNDILVLYTDGIVEATNNKFEFYGEDKLKEVILDNKNFSAKEIAEKIIESVQKFSARAKYSDDKTVVAVKRIK